MLEIYFSQLFTNRKACFKVRKIQLLFFSCRSLPLSTSILNDNIPYSRKIVKDPIFEDFEVFA